MFADHNNLTQNRPSPTLRDRDYRRWAWGLTFARLLQRNQISCSVFELESGPNAHNQGGTLDLHRDSGQLALDEVGLIEEFKKKARPEGEALKIISPAGDVLWDENGDRTAEFADRPEIDRVVLRDLLLNSLEPDRIRWGKKLQRVEPGKKNTHDLHFEDGIETGLDLVIGADGAWPKVRPLLTDIAPFYSGVTAIELWALDVEARNPWLSDYVGAGNCFMFDEGRALISQRNGNGSIRSYACVRQEEAWVKNCGIDWEKPDAARA
jgi:2-polyprenyl-6-methoxyphenol hydroxylase-like FAD-dependent oxidoreductase